MEPVFRSVGLKVAVLLLLTIQLRTDAMEVTSSGPQTIQEAQGKTVNLGCTYTPGPEDTGELDIEWSNVSPDMTQKDKLILSFTGGQTHRYGDPSVSSRLKFTGNPKQGDASISISDARVSDTATYLCKVKKAPGVDTRKVTLVVMGEVDFLFYRFYLFIFPDVLFETLLSFTWNVPVSEHTLLYCHSSLFSSLTHLTLPMMNQSTEDCFCVTSFSPVPPTVPKCWVEGAEEKGGPVSLRCKSFQGSNPLSYVWKRETGGAIPADATQDPQTGELLIRNHTDSNIGSYMCEAKNAVGTAQCKYALQAYNPTNKVGVIVGAVIGALLLLLLLLLLIWLLVCCCHKRRYQKEVANEIREDAQAPESRPASRNPSVRSVMGYRTHAGVVYSSVRRNFPSVSESGHSAIYSGGSNGTSQPASAGDRRAPLQYDHRYGYPV